MAAQLDRLRTVRRGTRWLSVLALGLAGGAVGAAQESSPSACELGLRQTLAASEAAAVLALLSPRMPYALQEWTRMEAVAEQAGFQITAFRDPRVSLPEWTAGVEAAGLPALKALPALDQQTAADCQLLNHAPSALVGRCGRWHAWPVLGVMPDTAWLTVLTSRREAIACP